MKKRELSWLVYFLFAVGLFSFVIIPFCGDVEVFLGSSRLADYYGRSLVYNSFNVWEIKGVFLRLFFYALYSVVRLLAPCPSMEFSIILSLLYAVLVIALSWFIACNAITDRDDRPLFAASFCTAFFAIDSWCKMQAEMTCTLLLFVALSLALKRGGRELLRLLMSGVLIGFLFWFKAPLLLLSVCFAAGFLMLSESPFRIGLKKIFVVAVGSLVSLLLVGILVYYINPNEYSRMLMASIYQNTLLSGNGFTGMYVVKRFITGFAKAMLSIPALFIGAACLIVNFVHNIQEKEYERSVYHFILWAVPTLYVMLSNCYFIYHYLTFMFAAILEIWSFLGRNMGVLKNRQHASVAPIVWGGAFLLCLILSHIAKPVVFYEHIDLVLALIGALLLISLFFTCLFKDIRNKFVIKIICAYVFLIYFIYSALFSSNSLTYIELTASSYRNDFTLPMEKDEKLLYLDAGDGAYCFGYNTYYEEYYPLILQHIDENSERSKLQRYVEASEKVLSYSGDFICLTEDFIFLNGKNAILKKKIEAEYELYKRFNVYFTPTSIFSLQTNKDMHQLDIYKRKRH